MSALVIDGLRVAAGGREILRGIDVEVKSGEVHAVMGPNGAGKSTLANILMGHSGYEVTGGSVRLDGLELLSLPTWQRAAAGLFLAPQEPGEIPGVPLGRVLEAACEASEGQIGVGLEGRLEAERVDLGVEMSFLERGLNVDCSGGEKKRLETLQLLLLEPKFAILDELDSGLDIDALRRISRRIERASSDDTRPGGRLGVLAITHYRRLLDELHPDVIHVLVDGRLVAHGGFELADELEESGYAAFADL